MALPSQSPVPPADGLVTDERLAALLRLAAEYDQLDFKHSSDLSKTRDEVELAKDVGAMQVKGGYIVIGVDNQGNPTGAMDTADASHFDPANLVPKMQKYLAGRLDTAAKVLTWKGKQIILICVKANPGGCAFFQIEGKYQDDDGDEVVVFRRGEVFWRENTRSVRISIDGLEEIIERRFAARREELLREWAAAQQALGVGQLRAGGSPPQPTFALPADELVSSVIELLRADDQIGLRQLLDDGRRRARTYIADQKLAEDQLPTLLDSIICLAATFLTHEQEAWFKRTVLLLVDAYSIVATAIEVKRLGFSSHVAPAAKAPPIWLAIIERVFALGGLAVRREAWEAVRMLAIQLPGPLAEAGYEANWLRHALTMASRAQKFAPTTPDEPEIGLIDLARDDAVRLDCLHSDGVQSEDELLTSIVQFDVLSNLAAIDHAGSTDSRVFYTNFARFRQDRMQPAANRLLTDSAMRAEIFRGTDAELAKALAEVGRLGASQGMRYDGFFGWFGTPVADFIDQHLPQDEEP